MLRPCFLVIDPEHSGSISTRKLIIETAKFNVITAYSGAEAIETLKAFPAVSGVVLDAAIKDIRCEALVGTLKQVRRGIPVIAVGAPRATECDGADHFLDSFDPARLLDLLRSLEPDKTDALAEHEKRLDQSES
jgi:DNA-binding NtrC family response regulator